MRAPMGIVALALAAGIGLDWGLRPGLFWITVFLTASGVAAWFLRRRTGWANLSLVFLLIGFGVLRAELDRREPPPAFGPVALEGWLSGDPELSRDGRSFAAWFRAESAGLIQVRLPSRAGQFRFGERLKLHGMLRPGRTAEPAIGRRFDERRWLWVHGAGGVLNVTGGEGIVRLEERPSLWIRYRRWVARLRGAVANQGRLLLAPEQAGMLEGLMLGEGRGIRPEIWEAFRKTGTLHVLVVSGSHVGLIGLISLTGLAILRTPRAARA
ncbi:MAG: ComEC/Rec2 family competence protein, partial [Candidatus Omnitrophota bacterium]|nr:ComEC/Rec2 family competence protein [Candidatus Omnitrophota bacterium]